MSRRMEEGREKGEDLSWNEVEEKIGWVQIFHLINAISISSKVLSWRIILVSVSFLFLFFLCGYSESLLNPPACNVIVMSGARHDNPFY